MRVKSSLDICSRSRTRCTTVPDDGTRHPQLQPELSSAGTENRWVLSWRFSEASDSSGARRTVGSRFQILEPYAAKLRWPINVQVQGTRRAPETAERDWRRPSVDAAGTQRSAYHYCAVCLSDTFQFCWNGKWLFSFLPHDSCVILILSNQNRDEIQVRYFS